MDVGLKLGVALATLPSGLYFRSFPLHWDLLKRDFAHQDGVLAKPQRELSLADVNASFALHADDTVLVEYEAGESSVSFSGKVDSVVAGDWHADQQPEFEEDFFGGNLPLEDESDAIDDHQGGLHVSLFFEDKLNDSVH